MTSYCIGLRYMYDKSIYCIINVSIFNLYLITFSIIN